MLRTEGLTKRFGELTAVNSVNLHVEKDRLHAIIGPNGAGKTTLFHLLTGTLRPTSGEILFKGKPITAVPQAERVRMGIARSFQKTSIFPRLTVRENVLLAVLRAQGARGFGLLSRGKALGRALPVVDDLLAQVGLESVGHVPAHSLPYGSQRILDVAMALACQPELLLLDEPTSGLSAGELDAALELIHRLAQRYTVVLIEHNMELVMRLADKVTVLHFGSIIAEGTPAEVRDNKLVQEAYFGGVI